MPIGVISKYQSIGVINSDYKKLGQVHYHKKKSSNAVKGAKKKEETPISEMVSSFEKL